MLTVKTFILLPGAFVLGYLITFMIQPGLLDLISKSGFVRLNFKNNSIPTASGVVFPAAVIAGLIPLLLVWPQIPPFKPFVFAFVVSWAALLGLIDDFWGSRETSGLKGHLGTLLKGRITTGGFKAVWGGLLSILVALEAGPPLLVPLNALLLALTTNAINLLDLRPGRAGKVFVVAAIPLVISGWDRPETALALLLLGSLLAYLPLDLKAKTMMGDTGSNALGAGLGLAAVWILEPAAKLFLLLALVLFHLITEKYSLTRIIARNPFLNFLDYLGRGK